MKALFVYPKTNMSVVAYAPLRSALEELGWTVDEIHVRTSIPDVLPEGYDLTLYHVHLMSPHVANSTSKVIQSAGGVKVGLNFDSRDSMEEFWKPIWPLMRQADFCAVTAHGHIPDFEKRGIKCLPWYQAYPSNIFHPKVEPDKSAPPVLFVGRFNRLKKSRVRWRAECEQRGLPITFMSGVWGHRLARLYKGAKINIDMSLHPHILVGSNRGANIRACGAFVLSRSSPHLEKIFVEGESMATWGDIDELEDKINYYLAHPGERDRIARNAIEINRKWFSGESAVMSLLEAAGFGKKDRVQSG